MFRLMLYKDDSIVLYTYPEIVACTIPYKRKLQYDRKVHLLGCYLYLFSLVINAPLLIVTLSRIRLHHSSKTGARPSLFTFFPLCIGDCVSGKYILDVIVVPVV